MSAAAVAAVEQRCLPATPAVSTVMLTLLTNREYIKRRCVCVWVASAAAAVTGAARCRVRGPQRPAKHHISRPKCYGYSALTDMTCLKCQVGTVQTDLHATARLALPLGQGNPLGTYVKHSATGPYCSNERRCSKPSSSHSDRGNACVPLHAQWRTCGHCVCTAAHLIHTYTCAVRI